MRALIELLHPAPILAVLAAAAGFAASAVRGWPPARRLVPLLLALLCTQLSISLHNDYCDRFLDAAAKPWRAIPRGLISPGQALGAALVLFGLGLVAAAPLGGLAVALVALGSGAGLAYNARFKRGPWTWVPYWVALPTLPICAYVAMGRFRPRLLLAYLVGGPLVLAVYLADTLSDVESDRAHGVGSLAVRLGPRHAPLVCWASAAIGLFLADLTSRRRAHPFYLAALCGLLIAPFLPRRHGRDPHWLAIITSVVATSLGWLAGHPSGD